MTGSDNVGSIKDIPMPPASPTSGVENQEGLSSWTPADYMRLLNVTTAKCLAILLVIAFGIYHSLLHATYGVTPCKGLLKDGMYKVRLETIVTTIICCAGVTVAAMGLYDAQVHQDGQRAVLQIQQILGPQEPSRIHRG